MEVIAYDGTRRVVTGAFTSFTSRYLTLTTGEPIGASLAVSVEYNDILFVGEVIACCEESSDCFEIQIGVEHALTNLQSLMKLNAELLGAQQVSADHKIEYVHVRK